MYGIKVVGLGPIKDRDGKILSYPSYKEADETAYICYEADEYVIVELEDSE